MANHSWSMDEKAFVTCEQCGLMLRPNTKTISRDGKKWRTVKKVPKCTNPDEEPCPGCDGLGWCIISADHSADIRNEEHPVDLPEIQKCDECRIFVGDDEAQEQFLKDVVKGKAKLPKYLLLQGED